VQARFGSKRLRTYPHLTLWDFLWYRHARKIRFVNVLDYVNYSKAEAMETIQTQMGWQPYDRKHHESIYTRFYQSYILPRKFGVDKRKMHLSTLIVSGQKSRDEALRELAAPIAPEETVRQDKIYACKKLGLSEKEFDDIMRQKPLTFWDYPSCERSVGMKLYRRVRPMNMPVRVPCHKPAMAGGPEVAC
jgi:hypothetical protein